MHLGKSSLLLSFASLPIIVYAVATMPKGQMFESLSINELKQIRILGS